NQPGGGVAVAFGSVSLIVSGNQRPVASALVTPQEGVGSAAAPLAVTFDGSASTDFDGTIAQWAWDRTGDGIYEKVSTTNSNTSGNFSAPGTYNAKLRVTDDKGAWDVDSAVVTVLPVPAVTLSISPPAANPGDRIDLSAATSTGTPVKFEWDF